MKFGIIIAAGVLVLGTSAFAQLNRTQTNQSSFTTFTEVTGGVNTWSGIWGGHPAWLDSSSNGQQFITISADVELWGSSSLDNSRIYFHKANDQNPGPAILNGTLYSNRGMWVGVVGPPKNGAPALLDKLIQTTNYAGTPVNPPTPATDVPLTWTGRWTSDNGANWTPWHTFDAFGPGSNNTVQNAYWWRMANSLSDPNPAGGYFNFQIQCAPHFAPLQPGGAYELDPVLVMSPEL